MSFVLFIQLRGNQKDLNFQLHCRLSKFEVPAMVNLKHIFELFGLYTTCFLIQKLLELIRSSSDGQFWKKKAKIKKAGNLNQGRSYVITTVQSNFVIRKVLMRNELVLSNYLLKSTVRLGTFAVTEIAKTWRQRTRDFENQQKTIYS